MNITNWELKFMPEDGKTFSYEVIERATEPRQDSFEIYVNGKFFSSHARKGSAERLAQRFIEALKKEAAL